MPDKLLGIYEYLLYDAPNGSVEGKSAGELVDYMCYGTYRDMRKDVRKTLQGCLNPIWSLFIENQ